jgi:parallel beta-helix repeat protein
MVIYYKCAILILGRRPMKIMLSKALVFAVIIFFIGAGVVPSISSDNPSFVNTIYVDDDAPPEWYDATHVRTIQEGIDNASDGDTVFVFNGVYYTTHYTEIIINKQINLIGENRCGTIIDGKREHLFVVCICSEYVNISGFTIRNGDSPDEDFRYGAGIDIDGGIDYINISDNIISNNAYGIFLSQFNDNIIISNNQIIQNRNSGILLSGSNNKIIDNNITHNHEHGIFLIGSDNTILSRNTIKDNNQVGLKLLYDIDFLKNCRDNTIYQNNFINNKLEATITKTFIDSRIAKNIWSENFWDIPRVKPKLIFGSYVIMILVMRIPIIPIVEVDWHPAKEPYDIP